MDAVDVQRAHAAIGGAVLHTPTIPCEELGQAAGAQVELKAECLQLTGSFKLRGALSKLASLGAAADGGLVTASAGNHARAVAHAARARGVACDVHMPVDAPVSKVAAIERLGATVHLEGGSVDEALASAQQWGREKGRAFVHPFDDPDVIAGQGTIGIELLADVPGLARVVVPIGGGGLACGIGIALAGAGVELVGVQAQACSPLEDALRGEPDDAATISATIADGIAIKHPGRITLPLLRELLSHVVTVAEDEIADGMVFLAERAHLVAEGAGAAAVAALLSGRVPPTEGTTVAIVSGGNVDSGLLASLLRRHETEEGRRVRLFTRVADRPGGLAELLDLVARARANLLTLEHLREAVPLHVRETGVELILETRGPAHTREVVEVLEAAGYEVTVSA